MNETDQEFKVSKGKNQYILDMLFLEKLYQTKIKRDCLFLKDVDFRDITSGGVCMQAAYSLSLIYQQMIQDFKAGNKQAGYKDLDDFITVLPDTLSACGQSHMAD